MSSPKNKTILITCEHGGNRIPPMVSDLFVGHNEVLDSHEGWDAGALDIARFIAKQCNVVFFYEETSRLVIDQNRSPDNPGLFSRFTQSLPSSQKNALITSIYQPYHEKIETYIRSNVATAMVYHFSIHSFTPSLDGHTRVADIGLLFDPSRHQEKVICDHLALTYSQKASSMITKMNYPYKGTDDGLTTSLRRQFRDSVYTGIEIEINQKLITYPKNTWEHLKHCLAESIELLQM